MDLTRSGRLRRSLLFVPGAERRKLERACGAGADTLLLDLEDSVAPAQKADARQQVAAALRAGMFGETEAAVRVNAPGTPYFEDDVESMVLAGARVLLLPKSETPGGVRAVVERLERLEGTIPDARESPVQLLLLVESPAGITGALALGRSAPRVEALCFGHADFSLEMGLQETDASVGIGYHARCALVIAAKACGVAPIDSVHTEVRDETAFRRDAELGLRLGFEGKLCIHPRQVEIANEVYTPRQEQVEYALRVVGAAREAEAEGRGVFTLNGKMIDAPVIAAQRRVLSRARRAGLLHD